MKKLLGFGMIMLGVVMSGFFMLGKEHLIADDNPNNREEGKVRVCITDLPEAIKEKKNAEIYEAIMSKPSKVYNREEEPIIYDPNALRMADMTDDELYDKLIELDLYLESWSKYDNVKEIVVRKARYALETGYYEGANFTENTELALRIRTIVVEYEGMEDVLSDEEYEILSKTYEFRRPYTYSHAE